MAASAENIWRVPVYLPYLQPVLTDEAVIEAERKLNFKLPPEFLRLLRRQNGGYIRFSLPDIAHERIAGIGPHFPSLTNFDWGNEQEFVSFPLQGLIPFDGDGHWHICLDYRGNSHVPSVTYIDVECDHSKLLAHSFSEYLSMLEIDYGDKYVIESVFDIEDIKLRLSATLRCEFAPVDVKAHGYPVHRAALGNANKPEWLWISPNLVPRGFVRSNDPRYGELKGLMPGESTRFPELSENDYLIQATNGVRAKVVDGFTCLRLPIRALTSYLHGK